MPVWYAAYGSNCDRERFGWYLRECTDTSGPLDDRPYVLPHARRFAGSSSRWEGGGVAFLDPDPYPDAATRARLRGMASACRRIAARLDAGRIDGPAALAEVMKATFGLPLTLRVAFWTVLKEVDK